MVVRLTVRYAVRNFPKGNTVVFYRIEKKEIELLNEGTWLYQQPFVSYYAKFLKQAYSIPNGECFIVTEDFSILFMRIQNPEQYSPVMLIEKVSIRYALIRHWETLEIPLIRRNFTPSQTPMFDNLSLIESMDPESKDAIAMRDALRLTWFENSDLPLNISIRFREDESSAALIFSNSEIKITD